MLRPRPRKAEAASLRVFLEDSENLMAPNLQAQLSLAAPYSEKVTDFLVHTTSVGLPTLNSDMRASIGRRSMEIRSSRSTFETFWEDGSDSRRNSTQELTVLSYTNVPNDPNAHIYKVSSIRQFVVPFMVIKDLTRNFNVDFISEDSPMFHCPELLPVVMKQALKTTGIGFVIKEQASALQLLAFARRMEAGYLDGGYHSKRPRR